MNRFVEDLKTIYYNERLMLITMAFNLLMAMALAVFTIANLNPASPMVVNGYGDIGGYRYGNWTEMLAFLIFAVVFGVFHNLLALLIYRKRGAGMTKFFVATTTMLILGAFIVLIRLK